MSDGQAVLLLWLMESGVVGCCSELVLISGQIQVDTGAPGSCCGFTGHALSGICCPTTSAGSTDSGKPGCGVCICASPHCPWIAVSNNAWQRSTTF